MKYQLMFITDGGDFDSWTLANAKWWSAPMEVIPGVWNMLDARILKKGEFYFARKVTSAKDVYKVVWWRLE